MTDEQIDGWIMRAVLVSMGITMTLLAVLVAAMIARPERYIQRTEARQAAR